MNVKELLSTRYYKAGYEIRTVLIDGSDYGSPDTIMKMAYTRNGDYMGGKEWGHRLCVKRGIAPEKISPEVNICQIGFSNRDQKWYGWSHRAIYGFEIGSSVVKGDIAYVSNTFAEMWGTLRGMFEATPLEERGEAYFDPRIRNLALTEDNNTLVVSGEREMQHYAEEPDVNGAEVPTATSWEPFTERYELGKGEWTAQTLVDAKEMAVAFANDIA